MFGGFGQHSVKAAYIDRANMKNINLYLLLIDEKLIIIDNN